MTFVLLYTVMLAMRGFSVSAAAADRSSECGVRPPMSRRNARATSGKFQQQQQQQQFRHGRIIDGSPTREGQFPWQVSLELLHPSLGFIGHWCGAVLIDQYWVLSAAHCIHNDLFNLPLPPLWTVVLGEFNRHVESGYEQRISVDRIIMHQDYENYQHDLVMIKLAEPADMGAHTTVRKICLPFIAFKYPQSVNDDLIDALDDDDGGTAWSVPERDDNSLRAIKLGTNRSARRPRSHNTTATHNHQPPAQRRSAAARQRTQRRLRRISSGGPTVHRRRNDKFLHGRPSTAAFAEERRTAGHPGPEAFSAADGEPPQDLPYVDCIATGWGKSTISGDLTEILLQTQVPIHPNGKCTTAYGENVRIHRGHLCAGKLNGKGGTCVGDSGGPLQCRISQNGPWMLAGVTSFGSGCAEQGYPDVYSRISHYVQWITETMQANADGEE